MQNLDNQTMTIEQFTLRFSKQKRWGKLRSSDKSDKSMDLLKSVKSEDLSKDLQVNPRISPQTVKDFMMNG